MRTPDSLTALVDHGIIEEVLRPLMSGKEAQVYLVVSGGQQCVAKIYKEAQNRSFQNRADYTEGRKVRNSRDQRAMGRGSRHGKAQNEAAWRSAEVDMIYRLRDAGVRVPQPQHYIDGVLIMELVVDAEGFPAPRLGDLVWEPADAEALFKQLLGEVVRMLSVGVVHGDLSDFNVLMSASGPVVIDFPQSVDAATNANARKLLIRDVDNLHRFASKFEPAHAALPYAEEMWELYKRNALTPDTQLSGRYRSAHKAANTTAVLDLISDANRDERKRREARGMSLRGTSAEATPPLEHAPEPRSPVRERSLPARHDTRRAPPGREAGGAARNDAPARHAGRGAAAERHDRSARPAARDAAEGRPAGRNFDAGQSRPAGRNFDAAEGRPAARNFDERPVRPAPRNFDEVPPGQARSHRAVRPEPGPRAPEPDRELRWHADDRDPRAVVPERAVRAGVAGRDERASNGRSLDRAREDRPRPSQRPAHTSDPRPAEAPTRARQDAGRPGERRVGASFGERVPHRARTEHRGPLEQAERPARATQQRADDSGAEGERPRRR